jgi:hypothetical protein
MKRQGNLWQQVISFPALLRAALQACKGKRFRPTVADFHFNLEPELWALHEELSTKTYCPGAYRSFSIDEPKLEESGPHNHTPVSICYLSVDVTSLDPTRDDWLDFVMEGRRLACDRRYRERLRQLNRLFSRAG